MSLTRPIPKEIRDKFAADPLLAEPKESGWRERLMDEVWVEKLESFIEKELSLARQEAHQEGYEEGHAYGRSRDFCDARQSRLDTLKEIKERAEGMRRNQENKTGTSCGACGASYPTICECQSFNSALTDIANIIDSLMKEI